MARPSFAYAFRPGENVERGFHRILTRMEAQAAGVTKRTPGDITERVHEGRLLIKRLRALLWFAKPAFDESVLIRAKEKLREAAAHLAAQRDQTVTMSVLRKLSSEFSKSHEWKQDALPAPPTFNEADDDKGLLKALRTAMKLLRTSVIDVKKRMSPSTTWPPASQRLERAFKAMHRAEKKVHADGTDVNFHEWRKKAKNLLYQLELTHAHPSPTSSRLIARVDKLQENLGAFHDCVVAEAHLQQNPPDDDLARHLFATLQKRKRDLRKKAKKIAQRLPKCPSGTARRR